MKLDFKIYEVLPDELNHSRKWVCEIINDTDGVRFRRERIVSNEDSSRDERAKYYLAEEVMDDFMCYFFEKTSGR